MSAESILTVYYDGKCPLCSAEIKWLSRSSSGTKFEDLNDPNCSAYRLGLTKARLMAQLCGSLDGASIEGLKVFREMYARAGKKHYLAWTAWPGIRKLADLGYMQFARNRSWISVLIAKVLPLNSCRNNICKLD